MMIVFVSIHQELLDVNVKKDSLLTRKPKNANQIVHNVTWNVVILVDLMEIVFVLKVIYCGVPTWSLPPRLGVYKVPCLPAWAQF